MSDISTIIIPNGNEYNIKDGSAVTNITRSGDTFTATRRNGTSFTFTQGHQDISGKLNTSLKGANNGLAELDANGKVPTSQLPSYVDDVIEANGITNFPSTGETGKIYVDTSTNKTYRWSGTTYTEISASLALGTTSSTAFRGDYGNSAYAHAVTNKGAAFTSGLYKITTNAEGHVTAATAVAKADITGLGIPGSDTNTHRPIQVNGTEVLGNNTTALNLKAGSNVTVTNSSGTVTIAATDTNTWRPVSDSVSSTSSSDAASSKAVKTAYDLAASKTSNTGTVTQVSAGTGLTGGNITTSGTIALATSGVTAGSAGPTAAVTGNNGTTVAIPRITVDAYGRVTALTSYNLTNVNTDSDTKNTAGSTNSTSKLFLIGATSQAANPTTNSNSECFVQNGAFQAKTVNVGGGCTLSYDSNQKCVSFVFS